LFSQKLDPKRVAVLRFVNVPIDANPYFGDGLTNEIQNALSRVAGINVVGQQSVFLVDPHEDPRDIGKRLNSGSIIAGSVRRDEDRLRITVEKIDANTGYQIWSETYDFHMSDTFEIQKEISDSIRHHFEPEAPPGTPAARPADLVAWTLYLR